MSEQSQSTSPWWANSATSKERNAIQRAVVALLDELAPELPASRAGRVPVAIERHRTPSGCVLQGPTAAVSVSWFPQPSGDPELGELHVLVWRGFVTRRGAAPKPGGSVVVGEMVLRPMEQALDGAIWRDAEGRTYDSVALAEHCVALLQAEAATIAAADPAAPND